MNNEKDIITIILVSITMAQVSHVYVLSQFGKPLQLMD